MTVINWPLFFFNKLLLLELICRSENSITASLYSLLRLKHFSQIKSTSSCLFGSVQDTWNLEISPQGHTNVWSLEIVKESLHSVQSFNHHKLAELENRSSGHSITVFDVVSFFFWVAALETCWGDAWTTGLQVLSNADVRCWPNKKRLEMQHNQLTFWNS